MGFRWPDPPLDSTWRITMRGIRFDGQDCYVFQRAGATPTEVLTRAVPVADFWRGLT